MFKEISGGDHLQLFHKTLSFSPPPFDCVYWMNNNDFYDLLTRELYCLWKTKKKNYGLQHLNTCRFAFNSVVGLPNDDLCVGNQWWIHVIIFRYIFAWNTYLEYSPTNRITLHKWSHELSQRLLVWALLYSFKNLYFLCLFSVYAC